MSWNEDACHHNIDYSDNQCCGPSDSDNLVFVICHNIDPVDDNLHQQLDLKDPKQNRPE